jgi:uncharacterized membrane protein (DUF106 family)
MLDTWLTSLAASLTEFSLDTLQVMPYSTLFILLISTVMNLIVSLVNRMATNIEEYREWTTKSTLLRREMMKAVQSGNKRLVEKLQKDQQESMKAQAKMQMQRLKLSLYFAIPFLAFWWVLGPFFGNNIVAIMPFDLPYIGTQLNLFWWYFFCSMAGNVLIPRLLGLTFEI